MERLKYIDTAKGYLMLLVVLGHVLIVLNPYYANLYYTAPQAFIYTFHMPAFFIIHGIIFDVDKWRRRSVEQFVVHRLQTLIVPYCFFEVMGMVWRKVFYNQSLGKGLCNLITIRCNVGADWFLPAMFLGSLLFLICIKRPNRVYGILSTVVCFLLPMVMGDNQLLTVIGRGLLAYAFIMCGYLFKNLFLSEKIKSAVWMIVSLAVTAVVAIVGLKYGGNDFYTCTIQNPIALWVGGMSGTALIIGLSRILPCKVITNVIGNHTLSIMGTHQLAIYAMTALLPALTGGTIIQGLLLLMAILVFEIPMVWLIDSRICFLTGRQGRRGK